MLAEEEPLTLTEISHRLHRTPGSTKDYLSWLEDVDLVTSRQKRYSFTDPVLRLWVRLHCHPVPPTEEDVAREVQHYALARLPQPGAAPGARLRRRRCDAGRAQKLGHYRDRLIQNSTFKPCPHERNNGVNIVATFTPVLQTTNRLHFAF